MYAMKNRTLVKAMTLAAISCTPLVGWAQGPNAAKPQQQQQQQQGQAQPIGRVTAAFGVARADTAAGSHPLDIQSLINNDERIVTDGGGLTVLLSSRVVLKVDVDSAISIFESPTQTTVSVQYGTVHLYVGQRAPTAGVLSVQDPNGRTETASGVFLAHYDPKTHESYIACEHQTVNIAPKSEHAALTITGDHHAIVRDGKVVMTGDLDRVAFNDRKKSLDRLGQATVSRGADTFRLRSRAFDTESAINQLSAAGWIDRRTLPNSNPVVATNNNGSAGNSGSTSTADGAATSLTEVKTGQPIKSGNKTSNGNGAVVAADTGSSNTAAPTNVAPAEAAAAVPAPVAVVAPDNSAPASDFLAPNTPAPSNTAPTGTLTLGAPPKTDSGVVTTSAPPVATTAPPAISIAPSAPSTPIDLGSTPAPVSHPVVDVVNSAPEGPGTKSAGTVVTVTPSTPIHIDLGGDSGSPKVSDDLGSTKGVKPDKVTPKIDKEQTASIPKVDLGIGTSAPKDSAPPKGDIAPPVVSAPVASPVVTIDATPKAPTVDLGSIGKDKGNSPAATPSPVQVAPAPVQVAPPPVAIAPATPRGIDLGLGSAKSANGGNNAPKTDIGMVQEAPKVDVPSVKDAGLPPKTDIDLGSAPTKDATAGVPKDTAAPTKDAGGDLASVGIKDSPAVTVPKAIDIGIDVKPGDDKGTAGITVPGVSVGPTKDGADVKVGDVKDTATATGDAIATPVEIPSPDQAGGTDKTGADKPAAVVDKATKKHRVKREKAVVPQK